MIWRKHKLFVEVSRVLLIYHRFGGGFELMRDGRDKIGIWTMLEESLE